MGKEDKIYFKEFIVGAFLGGIAGAGAALLFAPKPGRELRQDLGEQTITIKEKGTNLAQKAMDKSSDLAKVVSDQSSNVVSRVKDLPILSKVKGEEEDTIEAETLRELKQQDESTEKQDSTDQDPENN